MAGYEGKVRRWDGVGRGEVHGWGVVGCVGRVGLGTWVGCGGVRRDGAWSLGFRV